MYIRVPKFYASAAKVRRPNNQPRLFRRLDFDFNYSSALPVLICCALSAPSTLAFISFGSLDTVLRRNLNAPRKMSTGQFRSLLARVYFFELNKKKAETDDKPGVQPTNDTDI
jgi:hypothetical protein